MVASLFPPSRSGLPSGLKRYFDSKNGREKDRIAFLPSPSKVRPTHQQIFAVAGIHPAPPLPNLMVRGTHPANGIKNLVYFLLAIMYPI